MIDDGQLRIWAAEAKEARELALWEYCPKEFWLLLTEIAELKQKLEGRTRYHLDMRPRP